MHVIVTTSQELEAIIGRCIKEIAPQIYPQTVTEQAGEIIDTTTLCKRLGITEPTCLRYRKKKLIPFFTIGSAIRYNWASVMKALESSKKVKG